jgi:GWxTD domain-containing protein
MNKMNAFQSRSRLLLSVLTLAGFLCPPGALAQSSLSELFQRGKTESKLGSYEASLATFQKLDELSRQPGNESDRVKLEPLIAFYRGVNLAALGEEDAARTEFEIYLASYPRAHLNPAAFPRSVIEVFDKAREKARLQNPAAGGPPKAGEESPIALAYAKFRPDPKAPPVFDQKWAEGAIRFLMMRQETEAWQRVGSSQERAEFVTKFWQRRDPNPLTPENEFRDEVERRIQFADARFAQEETRGSATDRGLVFVLLGPPSYIAQRPFKSEDDSIQAARNAPTQEVSYDQQGRRVVKIIPRTALTAETLQGTREIWYYRRDRLPKAVRFPEVNFEFITKKGLGTAVLQREHDILVTLDLAAKATLPSNKESSN